MAKNAKSNAAFDTLRAALTQSRYPMTGLDFHMGVNGSAHATKGKKVVALLAGDKLFLDWNEEESDE